MLDTAIVVVLVILVLDNIYSFFIRRKNNKILVAEIVKTQKFVKKLSELVDKNDKKLSRLSHQVDDMKD